MQNPQASSTVPTRGYLQAPQVQNERGRGSISLHDGRRALKGGEGIAAPSRPSRALLSPFPSLQGHAGRHPPPSLHSQVRFGPPAESRLGCVSTTHGCEAAG